MHKTPNLFDGKQAPWTAMFARMADQRKTNDPVAERIRTLRERLGYDTSNAFAELLGVSATRLNNVENGAPLSRDLAFLLVQKVPGLSLDWLYFGKIDGLPVQLARLLGEIGPARNGRTESASPETR